MLSGSGHNSRTDAPLISVGNSGDSVGIGSLYIDRAGGVLYQRTGLILGTAPTGTRTAKRVRGRRPDDACTMKYVYADMFQQVGHSGPGGLNGAGQ